MYNVFLLHSSVEGHLGCFHALAIVTNAAVFWQDFSLPEKEVRVTWACVWRAQGGGVGKMTYRDFDN